MDKVIGVVISFKKKIDVFDNDLHRKYFKNVISIDHFCNNLISFNSGY